MPIRISDGFMRLKVDGQVVATATERPRGWWEVIYRPQFFDRNQAITALKVPEPLESGRMAAGYWGGSASAEPGFPVEQFACDLEVAGVRGGLLDHV
jgi:hypothetical protein